MKKSKATSTAWVRFLFVVYAGFLLWLLFDRESQWSGDLVYQQLLRENMNLTPFHTIGAYWKCLLAGASHPSFRHAVINLGGNIFLFIPIGYFFPLLWLSLRNFFSFLLTCTLSICLVELLQLVTLRGSLDIDDLILNLFGMLLGYLIYMIFKKKR